MRINDFIVTAAAVFTIPIRRHPEGLTQRSAPDEWSKQVLRRGMASFEDGAASAADVPATIERNLPAILEQSLARMPPELARLWVRELTNLELELLARLYVEANRLANRPGVLLHIAACRLDTAGLVRLARFFGYEEMADAVRCAAPRKFQDFAVACAIGPAGSVIVPAPQGAWSAGALNAKRMNADAANGVNSVTGATPSVDKTILQLYTGFRSMHSGATAAVAASYETAAYCGEHLVAAWGTGFYFGAQITALMQLVAPQWYGDKFAPGVGAPLDYAQSLVLTIGRYFAAPLPLPSEFRSNHQSPLLASQRAERTER